MVSPIRSLWCSKLFKQDAFIFRTCKLNYKMYISYKIYDMLLHLQLNQIHVMHIYMLYRFSCVQLYATLWTITCQVPLSIGFSRQEYWSGLPYSSPVDRPNPRIEPRSSTLQALSLLTELPGKPMKTGLELGSIALQADSLPAEL